MANEPPQASSYATSSSLWMSLCSLMSRPGLPAWQRAISLSMCHQNHFTDQQHWQLDLAVVFTGLQSDWTCKGLSWTAVTSSAACHCPGTVSSSPWEECHGICYVTFAIPLGKILLLWLLKLSWPHTLLIVSLKSLWPINWNSR